MACRRDKAVVVRFSWCQDWGEASHPGPRHKRRLREASLLNALEQEVPATQVEDGPIVEGGEESSTMI